MTMGQVSLQLGLWTTHGCRFCGPVVSDQGSGLYKCSLSTGLAYYGRKTDAAGLGLNWAESATSTQTQFTAELFYRFSLSSGLQITPSIQVIDNPLDSPGLGTVTVLGLRTRLVF